MSTYLKLFENDAQYETFIGWGGVDRPNVSHCIAENEVHYNPIQYICKITLNDGSIVNIEGSGVLTKAMVSDQYKNTLVSAEVSELCTSIGYDAFSNCSSLTNIDIPNTVTSINSNAFYNCSSLTNMSVDSNNAVYDSRGNCNAIIETATNTLIRGCKNTVIPNGVTSIGAGAFSYCSGLTSVTIPDSVTSIGNGAFAGCSSLSSVTIGNGVTNIGNQSFAGCSGLTSITSLATTAPTITNETFRDVKTGGTLTVPSGSSDYDIWMGTGNYHLGKYNWTKVEQ